MAKEQILYLDDDTDDVWSLARLFNARSTTLEIVPAHPKQFTEQLESIKSNIARYAAIILDLRLDKIADAATQETADYRAMTLAQELRTLAFEKEIQDIPIFLLSVEEKYNQSYNGDDTGHDLFDLSFSKTGFSENVARYEKKIVAFIRAYRSLKTVRWNDTSEHALRSLKIESEYDKYLDPRFVARYEHIARRSPAHTTARFLHQKLVKRAGILISEDHLSARLGVDKKQSSDWPALVALITEVAGYTGPLCDGWRRWWLPVLSRWWTRTISHQEHFLSLSAKDRVSLLREKTNLCNLVEQLPIEEMYSRHFSTVCVCLREPLDPVDGYVVSEDSSEPWLQPMITKEAWLQPLYVSGRVLFNRAKYGFERALEPNEEERFQAINQHSADPWED